MLLENPLTSARALRNRDPHIAPMVVSSQLLLLLLLLNKSQHSSALRNRNPLIAPIAVSSQVLLLWDHSFYLGQILIKASIHLFSNYCI